MEVNEQLIRAITQAVVEQLHQNGAQPEKEVQTPETSGSGSLAGRTRMRPNRSTKTELVLMAQELLEKYSAPHCAKLVLEAAEIYEKRGILL